jgi:hypothetical protein
MQFTRELTSSYYGYRNDEDGILEKFEHPVEEEM